MKNMKKFMAVMAVASLVATSTITVSAFEYEGPQGTTTDEEATTHGHTTFSVVEAKAGENPNNVSFTVPLYVTMSLKDGATNLVTPSNYEIRNTSPEFDHSAAQDGSEMYAYDISVIGMNFEKLEDSTYNTVSDLTGKGNKDMLFSIGGFTMPALSAAGAADVILSSNDDTAFYNGTSFTRIVPNGTLELPLVATLGAAAEVADNTAAVAQFQVKYTVAAVVTNGNGDIVLLAEYVGDDRIAAGLEPFVSAE